MARRTVDAWLRHQESLHSRPVDLGLDRVRAVLARLPLAPPPGRVIAVAGTNGKGSTVTLLHDLLQAAGARPGLYTSPHLVRYHERIRLAGSLVTDDQLLDAFERVEEARRGDPLTFFEFGTLAAFAAFAAAGCDTWVLEVGLGGRLDAVNAVDADVALITTIGLDHQELLGHTLDEIAREKAGILRPCRPALYGDEPVPGPVLEQARRLDAPLACLGRDFSYEPGAGGQGGWTFRWHGVATAGLVAPPHWTDAQYRNASLVLAALASLAQPPVLELELLNRVLPVSRPDGRFQLVQRRHQWVLDVAHNPQAAAVLRAQLATLPPVADVTVVVALLADKVVREFALELAPLGARWIIANVDDPRASPAARMGSELARAGVDVTGSAESPAAACALAQAMTPPGGRIVVCGSFRVVGPALQWLGLY